MKQTAFENISCGMFVITSFDGHKHNGMICNTVFQVTNTPNRVVVSMNKQSYSHDVIKETGRMNVNILSVKAKFDIFERFGFQSGRNVDKFASSEPELSQNGLAILRNVSNSYISLEVKEYVDLGTHGMFICDVAEEKVISGDDSMTYDYYHKKVKPSPKASGKKGWVCKICGYVHEGDLPEDFVCPWCLHPAEDFEPIE